jgi:hypothetical protein
MTRRPLIALLVPLALAGCHKRTDDATAAAVQHGAVVPCALGGAKAFKPDCAVERSVAGEGGGLMLIMHHPDGGFRRLLVTTDGRGVVTADGSDEARVAVIDPGTIEVTVGDDRYHLPATVKGRPLPKK